MKKISIDKLFKSFMIVIVVLVIATILTHINDNRNLQKDEVFIREAFLNGNNDNSDEVITEVSQADIDLCSRYDGSEKLADCINSTDNKCDFDVTSSHCRPIQKTTECRKYQVYDYDGNTYNDKYNLFSKENGRSFPSTDDCINEVPNALATYDTSQQNLRATEIKGIGNRISSSKETTKNAVDDYIEREQQQNSQVDIQKQEEITAAQVVISHKHNLDTLRHKIYKEIGAI